MMKYRLMVSLLLCFACGKNEKINPDRPQLKNIAFDFETTLDEWINLGGSGERKFESDIQRTEERSFSGDYACQFTVSPESYVGKGNRAELTFDQEATAGDESWYEWSFYIPHSYQDVPLEDKTGAPNWQVIGQWHQQPDLAAGETWDNYPDAGKSVPIALNYHYFSKNDPSYLELLEDPETQQLYGFQASWDDVSAIALSYGDPPKAIAIQRIEKETWYRIKLHIKWSQQADGFVEAWINDQPFSYGKHHGLNMLNEQSHYFKFGLYRNPTIPFTNFIYYDDVKIW